MRERLDAQHQWERIIQKYNSAVNLKELSRLSHIIPLAEAFVARFPRVGHVQYLLAALLARSGHNQRGLGVFEAAAKLGYGPDAFLGAAYCSLALNDKVRTLWWLVRHILTCPDEAVQIPFFVFLRLVEETQGYDAWDDYLAAVMEADNRSRPVAFLFRGLAYCLKKNGQTAEALEAFREAQQDPIVGGSDLGRVASRLMGLLNAKKSNAYDELRKQIANEELLKQKNEEQEAWETRRREQEQRTRLQPNGELIFYLPSKEFGKVRDKAGQELFFHINYVYDPDLRERLERGTIPLPVSVSFEEGRGKYNQPTAQHIRQYLTKDQAVVQAEALAREGKYTEAVGVLERLQATHGRDPELESRSATWRDLGRQQVTAWVPKKKTLSVYQRAKEAHKNRDLTEAERLFREAIKKGIQIEGSVKELAMLLQQDKRTDEAIELLKEHLPRFPESIAALNILSTAYQHSNRHSEAIEILGQIRDKSPRYQLPGINKRIALSQFKSGNYEAAKVTLLCILDADPEDKVASRWLDALQVAEQTQNYDIKELPSLIDLEIELSPVLQFDLEQCEFFGLTDRDLATARRNEATEELFHRYHQFMDKFFDHQTTKIPRERAQHFLTGAKLLQMIGSEDQDRLRTYLRYYCAAMGDGAAADQKPWDVLRTYYAETFTVERVWKEGGQLSVKAAQFIISYLPNITYDTVVQNIPHIKEAIKLLFEKEPVSGFWHGLLNLFVSNRAAAENILPVIYDHPVARVRAVGFLEKLGIPLRKEKPTKEEFIQAWEEARLARSRDLNVWEQGLRSLLVAKINSLEVERLVQTVQEAKRDWLCGMDAERLETIRNILVENVSAFLFRSDSFEEKERRLQQAQHRFEELAKKIIQAPTRPSIGVFHPLIKHLLHCCVQAENDLLNQSTPVVELRLLIDQAVPDSDGVIPLRVQVSNQANCSPITDVRLTILPTPLYVPTQPTFELSESVRGGGTGTLACGLKVGPDALSLRALTVEAVLEYKDRRDKSLRFPPDELGPKQMSLRLYPESEFQDFPNPFAAYASGGPVWDPTMFKGREGFIHRITETLIIAKSKCYIFHGQKRVGKSSILFHLSEKLNKSDQFLCLSFSLADLPGVAEWSFAYRMLTSIRKSLHTYATNHPGMLIPEFVCPTIEELKDSPALRLKDKLEEFRWTMSQTPGWEHRRLVFTIDEFTYLYDWINDKQVPETMMKFWKGLVEQQLFSAVLVGQDTMPRFFDRFRNELISSQPERLTYLDPKSARELIEDPIRIAQTGETRYKDGAVERVLELTAGNPYYIQIFCDRLVRYMRSNRVLYATEVEVNEIALQLVHGKDALTQNFFDNLLAAGDFDKEREQVAQNWLILYTIALGSRSGGSAVRNCPSEEVFNTPELQDLGEKILSERIKDLEERLVIERPPQQPDAFRISIRLFRDWLLQHPPV